MGARFGVGVDAAVPDGKVKLPKLGRPVKDILSREEIERLERVLDDTSGFRGMTRAMAAEARCRCPRWRYGDAIDRADAEHDFAVRRSLVGSTKGMAEHTPTRRLALRELALRDPALTATAAWALAA
jgi:hypothetical protein